MMFLLTIAANASAPGSTAISLEQAQVELHHRCGVTSVIDVHSDTPSISLAVFDRAVISCDAVEIARALRAALHPECHWYVDNIRRGLYLRTGTRTSGQCRAMPSVLDQAPANGPDGFYHVWTDLRQRGVSTMSVWASNAPPAPAQFDRIADQLPLQINAPWRHGWGTLHSGEPYDAISFPAIGSEAVPIHTIRELWERTECIRMERATPGPFNCSVDSEAAARRVRTNREAQGLPPVPARRSRPDSGYTKDESAAMSAIMADKTLTIEQRNRALWMIVPEAEARRPR